MAVQVIDGGDAEALEDWEYPNFFGALMGDLDTVRRMIAGGADVNQVNSAQISPLLHALGFKRYQAARFLIDHGANVLHRDLIGTTPVHEICSSFIFHVVTEEETYEMCKFLLGKGAMCNSPNNYGITQLHYALEGRSLKYIKLLLDYGADITTLDSRKFTSLHFAARNPHVNVIDFVMNQGFDIECTSDNGASSLHYAAYMGNSSRCEFLLKRGANVHRKSDSYPERCTPLTLGVRSPDYSEDLGGRPRTVGVLLEYGANVGAKENGRSVLEIAASHEEERREDPDLQDLKPYTYDIKFILMRHVAKMCYTNSCVSAYDFRIDLFTFHHRHVSYFCICFLRSTSIY